MKFSLAIPAAVLALAGAAAALADIRGWTDAECKGSSIGCVGIGEGQCCDFMQALKSIDWSLSAETVGFPFTGAQCAEPPSEAVTGPQSRLCLTYNVGQSSARHVGGTPNRERRRRRAAAVTGEEGEGEKKKCVTPNQYAYYDDDGKLVTKKITSANVDDVTQWVVKGDAEKLRALEDY